MSEKNEVPAGGVCKGAWELGTACGKCERCLAVPEDQRGVRVPRGTAMAPAGELSDKQILAVFRAASKDIDKNIALEFGRAIIAADRALRPGAAPAGDAAMPTRAWEVRWTAGHNQPRDINPFLALTPAEFRSNPSRDEFALVRQSDAQAALAAKDVEIEKMRALLNESGAELVKGVRDLAKVVTERDTARKLVDKYMGERDALAARLDAQVEALRNGLLAALNGMIEHYVNLVSSGDSGNWNPEAEPEVIAARAAVKAAG